jgi:Flp pilus assembly protein TadD
VADPVEAEYLALLELDDDRQEQAGKIIDEESTFEDLDAGVPKITVRARVLEQLKPVRAAYEDFLRRHPDHARARLAYGSFLNDLSEEAQAVEQWNQARLLDPRNPAAWNNLANHYGHRGPVSKAFEYYAKAIELAPNEPRYLHNLAENVYLFRKDAMEYYHLTEAEVFEKALGLYRQAMRLAPASFLLASDYAQSFYGIRPPADADAAAREAFAYRNTTNAVAAWEHAFSLAADEIERQGVHIHLARLQINLAQYAEAQKHLKAVTLPEYASLRERLEKNLGRREASGATNAPPEPSR